MRSGDRSVLLIEDDEHLRRLLARHLASQGYAVAAAPSAEDAERMLADRVRPDLVLLDIGLPGATGWDLLRGPALRRVGSPPVVVASALALGLRRLAALGVAAYLAKPFPLEALTDTVERVLHDRAAGAPR